MAFNRDRSGRGGGFRSGGGPRFNDRGSRGPVEMHQAVCDNCQKNCEVPFRPTSGKPVYCSDCFDKNRGSDSRGGRNFSTKGGLASGWEEKRMFDATCDECKNSCKVPFQPSGEKPVYCSNCFSEKKGAGNNGNGQSNFKEQFEALNNKLDKILHMLELKPVEQIIPAEEVKIAKKRASKKK